MPRLIVPLQTGERYHVFNRGVDKRSVFQNKADYLRFYRSLDLFNRVEPVQTFLHAQSKFLKKDALVQIEAYCLLPNHFHLLLVQQKDGGISEFLKRLTGGYTSYFNERNDRSGSLFQGTFKRVHIEHDEYYRYLFAYINENHFVHGIERPDEIIYASSLHYQNRIRSSLIKNTDHLANVYDFKENVRLAREIYRRRKNEAGLLLETE